MWFEKMFSKSSTTREEGIMSTDVKFAKLAVHDKFEAQINAAEATLNNLKARAQTTKANVELKSITELLLSKQAILQRLHQLKKSDGGQWDRVKADLETRITDFEKSVKGIESKVKAN
jgi:multidrug resistance efflux pump